MRRVSRTCATAALAILSLAGCGSDKDKADSTAAPAASAATAPGGSAATSASSATPDSTVGTDASAGDGAAGVVNGTPDPCRLLPTASLAAVLGDPPPAPKTSIEPEAPLNHRQCEWKVPSDDFTGKVIYLSVTTTEGMKQGGAGGGSYTAKNLYDDSLPLYAAAVDVPGLGDGAFFTDSAMTDLNVLVGDTVLDISALNAGSDPTPVTGDQLQTLMKAAIASL